MLVGTNDHFILEIIKQTQFLYRLTQLAINNNIRKTSSDRIKKKKNFNLK